MIKGIYFPGLRPEAAWAAALAPLFGRLVVYDVAEEPPVAGGLGALPWDSRVVAPLGADRARFQALLREMTGREGEYFRGQMLAQAGRPVWDREEATVGNLTGALHQVAAGGAAGQQEKNKAERVWRARLLLGLAERLAAAEAEVSQGLAAVVGRQAQMLKALQGEDEASGEEQPLSPPPLTRKPWRGREQLAAWVVFRQLDPAPEPLLLTDLPEAAAWLGEELEKVAPGQGLVLPELWLNGDAGALPQIAGALAELVQGNIAAGRAAFAAAAQASSPVTPGSTPLLLKLQLWPSAVLAQLLGSMSGLGEGQTAPATPFALLGVAGPEEFYL